MGTPCGAAHAGLAWEHAPVNFLSQASGTGTLRRCSESPKPCLLKPSDLTGVHKPSVCQRGLIWKGVCGFKAPVTAEDCSGLRQMKFPLSLGQLETDACSLQLHKQVLVTSTNKFQKSRVSVGGQNKPPGFRATLVAVSGR